MPWPKKSKHKGRVVKRTLADGTIKEYRYGAYRPKRQRAAPDSLDALIRAYQASPEWKALAPTTQANRSLYLRPLDEIGHGLVKEISRRDILTIRDAVAEARGNGAGSGFVKAVSGLFGWAVDRGWIAHSPVHRVKKLAGGHLPTWTEEQFDVAVGGLPEHLRRVVILARYTGQRRGDLCRMTWADYDGATIRLVQAKTKQPLVIPCHPELRAELEHWRAGPVIGLPAAPILTSARGRPWIPIHLSRKLPEALMALGLPRGLNVHGMRKLAATALAEAGCSPHEIGAITGHRTLAMVELYTRAVDQRRLAATAISKLTTIEKREKT